MTPWVRRPEELARLSAALERRPALALDTESDSLHHHREKVCLVQLASDDGGAWLVDPLAVGDLSPLGRALGDPAVTKVLHGADYDVMSLKRDFRLRLVNLFDTMIAARFLGLPAVGLQALLSSELGVVLSKESQKDDWSRRPLTPKQEAYALEDVRHLLALRERLGARLRELGRLSWVEEECAAVAELEPARRGPDPEAYLDVKGARRLAPRQLAVLRELFGWREALARSTDVPAFRVLGPQTLVAMAETPPRTRRDLQLLPGLPGRLRQRGDEVLAVIERALSLPEDELPRRRPGRPAPVVPPATQKRIDALRAWRALAARRLAVDVSVVLPQRLVEKVAEAAPRDRDGLRRVEGLRRWRLEALGAEMLAALGGRAVAAAN